MLQSPWLLETARVDRAPRARALAEGRLVEVTPVARQAGFQVPVALTAAVWVASVAWPWENWTQEARVRLWELLCAAGWAWRRHGPLPLVSFGLYQVPSGGGAPIWRPLGLRLGVGDGAEPVITIHQLGEALSHESANQLA